MKQLWKKLLSIACCGAVVSGVVTRASAEGAPEIPRIDSVGMAEAQPHEADAAVIWYDDFDHDAKQQQYPEKSGETTDETRFGDR